ncbi:MAG: YceI family protein [Pseudomonadota bacterium]
MRVVILLFAIFLVACGGQDTPSENENTLVERPDFATNYSVIAEQSAIIIRSTQEGEPFEGAFTQFDAMIYFDATDLPTSRVWVSVPIESLDAGSRDRNTTARNREWLDVEGTPMGVFESQTIRAEADGYVADGILTLRGTSLPFSLPFMLAEEGGQTVMTAQVPIERLDWGIGTDWNSGNYVGLTVTLGIRVVAEKT